MIGRINVWRCSECQRNTVCIDVDAGVTPFYLRCRATIGCKGQAVSNFYPPGPKPEWINDPEWEWYAPSAKQTQRMTWGMREHIASGGLALRRITSRGRRLFAQNYPTQQDQED